MKYLTAHQAADITGFSQWQLREWARQYSFDKQLGRKRKRGIEAVKVKRQWRFTEDGIRKFMEGK